MFRIGIIGAGSIVEGNHLPAINFLSQAHVAWVFDKNPSRMSLLSKMYNIPALINKSINEGLEQIDVCLLATPYGTRRPYIELCKEQKKALVVEKPFAFSKEEHTAFCSGFKEWEIAVNFQRRFYRSVAGIRKIIEENVFGKLKSIRLVQGNFTLKGGSGYLSSAELAGGGIIAESASHLLDIILSVTLAEDIRLLQFKSLHLCGLDYDTVFHSEILANQDRIKVQCEISTLRNLDNGLYLDFENAYVTCDLSPQGKVFVRDREMGRIIFSFSDEPLFEELFSQATSVNEAFLIFWQQFLMGLQQQQANKTSAYKCLVTSAWIGEIYKKIKLS